MTEGKLTRPELPRFGILKGMEDEDRLHLSDFGEFLPAHPKQQIITNGMAQDSLYLVVSGLLHVHLTIDGREKLITRIEAGETLGEVNLFDPAVASASVTAQEFSQIWKANRADIEAFVETYPKAGCDLLSGILAGMSRRIRNMNERLTDHESQNELLRMWH
jgi:CRP/FNR family cyclic AMP-dependent transcriptional regulator